MVERQNNQRESIQLLIARNSEKNRAQFNASPTAGHHVLDQLNHHPGLTSSNGNQNKKDGQQIRVTQQQQQQNQNQNQQRAAHYQISTRNSQTHSRSSSSSNKPRQSMQNDSSYQQAFVGKQKQNTYAKWDEQKSGEQTQNTHMSISGEFQQPSNQLNQDQNKGSDSKVSQSIIKTQSKNDDEQLQHQSQLPENGAAIYVDDDRDLPSETEDEEEHLDFVHDIQRPKVKAAIQNQPNAPQQMIIQTKESINTHQKHQVTASVLPHPSSSSQQSLNSGVLSHQNQQNQQLLNNQSAQNQQKSSPIIIQGGPSLALNQLKENNDQQRQYAQKRQSSSQNYQAAKKYYPQDDKQTTESDIQEVEQEKDGGGMTGNDTERWGQQDGTSMDGDIEDADGLETERRLEHSDQETETEEQNNTGRESVALSSQKQLDQEKISQNLNTHHNLTQKKQQMVSIGRQSHIVSKNAKNGSQQIIENLNEESTPKQLLIDRSSQGMIGHRIRKRTSGSLQSKKHIVSLNSQMTDPNQPSLRQAKILESLGHNHNIISSSTTNQQEQPTVLTRKSVNQRKHLVPPGSGFARQQHSDIVDQSISASSIQGENKMRNSHYQPAISSYVWTKTTTHTTQHNGQTNQIGADSSIGNISQKQQVRSRQDSVKALQQSSMGVGNEVGGGIEQGFSKNSNKKGLGIVGVGGGGAYAQETDFRRKTLNNFNSRSNKQLANHNVVVPSLSNNTSKQRRQESKNKNQISVDGADIMQEQLDGRDSSSPYHHHQHNRQPHPHRKEYRQSQAIQKRSFNFERTNNATTNNAVVVGGSRLQAQNTHQLFQQNQMHQQQYGRDVSSLDSAAIDQQERTNNTGELQQKTAGDNQNGQSTSSNVMSSPYGLQQYNRLVVGAAESNSSQLQKKPSVNPNPNTQQQLADHQSPSQHVPTNIGQGADDNDGRMISMPASVMKYSRSSTRKSAKNLQLTSGQQTHHHQDVKVVGVDMLDQNGVRNGGSGGGLVAKMRSNIHNSQSQSPNQQLLSKKQPADSSSSQNNNTNIDEEASGLGLGLGLSGTNQNNNLAARQFMKSNLKNFQQSQQQSNQNTTQSGIQMLVSQQPNPTTNNNKMTRLAFTANNFYDAKNKQLQQQSGALQQHSYGGVGRIQQQNVPQNNKAAPGGGQSKIIGTTMNQFGQSALSRQTHSRQKVNKISAYGLNSNHPHPHAHNQQQQSTTFDQRLSSAAATTSAAVHNGKNIKNNNKNTSISSNQQHNLHNQHNHPYDNPNQQQMLSRQPQGGSRQIQRVIWNGPGGASTSNQHPQQSQPPQGAAPGNQQMADGFTKPRAMSRQADAHIKIEVHRDIKIRNYLQVKKSENMNLMFYDFNGSSFGGGGDRTTLAPANNTAQNFYRPHHQQQSQNNNGGGLGSFHQKMNPNGNVQAQAGGQSVAGRDGDRVPTRERGYRSANQNMRRRAIHQHQKQPQNSNIQQQQPYHLDQPQNNNINSQTTETTGPWKAIPGLGSAHRNLNQPQNMNNLSNSNQNDLIGL